MDFRSFNVAVRKSNGDSSVKYIDAVDSAGATVEGSRYGKVLRVVEVKKGQFHYWVMAYRRKKGFSLFKKTNSRRQLEFLQTMSNMLVGYTIGEALSIMIQNFSGMVRDASQRLRQYTIIDQMDPVDALEKLGPKYLPKVTVAIIRSNSKVSSLNEAFREGLEFQREILKLQSSHAAAMTISIFKFLFAMSFVLLTYFYGFSLLDSVNYFALIPETGKAADSVVDMERYINITGILGLIVTSIWFSIILLVGVGRDISPEKAEKFILKLPLLNGAMLSRVNFITTYQIHKLLSKGVPLMETFKYVNSEMSNGVLKEDLTRVLAQLTKGDPEWVDSFHSFSDLDRALLKSATHQDEMANVFQAQSDQFLSSYDASITTLIKIHDVIAGSFLIVLIFILTLLMFLPMVGGFDLVDQAT
jgi:type II secretory pathway component PulF